jgi:hypothetical protein
MTFTPLIKGLITGAAVIGFSLLAYNFIPVESKLHFLVYAIYALGIIWTLIAYSNSSAFTGKFGDSFNAGFRCFIVATLLIVVYTFVFSKMHPEFAEESAKLYNEQLLADKTTSKTPDDIIADTLRYKNGYTKVVVYGTIFGYLIIGAGITAFGSILINRKK